MTKSDVIPGFRCVEFKNRVQAEIYEETKGLSHEQTIEYFRRSAETGPLAAWWKALETRDREQQAPRET